MADKRQETPASPPRPNHHKDQPGKQPQARGRDGGACQNNVSICLNFTPTRSIPKALKMSLRHSFKTQLRRFKSPHLCTHYTERAVAASLSFAVCRV